MPGIFMGSKCVLLAFISVWQTFHLQLGRDCSQYGRRLYFRYFTDEPVQSLWAANQALAAQLSPINLPTIVAAQWRKKNKKDSGRWCFVAKPRRRRQGYRKQAGNCKSAIVRRRRHALRGLTFCWPRQGQKYCEPLLNHTMGNVKKKKMWTRESTASENVEFGQKYWDTEKIKIVQKILTIVLQQLKKTKWKGGKKVTNDDEDKNVKLI